MCPAVGEIWWAISQCWWTWMHFTRNCVNIDVFWWHLSQANEYLLHFLDNIRKMCPTAGEIWWTISQWMNMDVFYQKIVSILIYFGIIYHKLTNIFTNLANLSHNVREMYHSVGEFRWNVYNFREYRWSLPKNPDNVTIF